MRAAISKRSDRYCASLKRSDRDCASCQIQVPDSSFRPCFKNQIPDSRFRTTKASAYSRFQIPGTGFHRPHMPVQIPVSKSPVQGLVDPGTDSRFQFPQSPSFQNTPTQIPVSRFQGQFPVDLAHQYRFQISDSKGWSGSQIRRKQNPGSSIQIGPRLQNTEPRLQNTGSRVAGGDYR